MLRNSPCYGATLVAWLAVGLQPAWLGAQPSSAPARPQQPANRSLPGGAQDRSLGAQGARIASQGVPDKGVPACANCHGAQGEGLAASGFPRLAGQSPSYLVRQIESYAQDTRSHPVMSPIAKAMTLEHNIATASYYAYLEPGMASADSSQLSPGSAPAAAGSAGGGTAGPVMELERGQRLANAGDEAAQIPACINCHGPGGVGEPPAYPYLAGQHASYLTSALYQWKNGNRKNDPSGQMQAIAARLSEADIAAVAAYYASQPPPSRPMIANPPGAPLLRKLPAVPGGGAPSVSPAPDSGGHHPASGGKK